MGSRWPLGAGLALVLFGAAACGGADDGPGGAAGPDQVSAQDQAQPPAPPEADLDGVPAVVAEVNGTEIRKAEFVRVYTAQFQRAVSQLQQSGPGAGQGLDQDRLKRSVIDAIIGAELLDQEAKDRGFTASTADVDQELEDRAEGSGLGSAEDFIAAVEQQGTSEQKLRTELEAQVRTDKLLAEEAGDLEPTEDEIQDFYDEVATRLGDAGGSSAPPPLEQIRPMIVDQLRLKKESETAQELIADYREDAEVTINL